MLCTFCIFFFLFSDVISWIYFTFAVDYVHSETTVTALMVAAGRGFFGTVEQLLNMGANVSAVSSNDWTALDWARQFEQHDIVELLETHMYVVMSDSFYQLLFFNLGSQTVLTMALMLPAFLWIILNIFFWKQFCVCLSSFIVITFTVK